MGWLLPGNLSALSFVHFSEKEGFAIYFSQKCQRRPGAQRPAAHTSTGQSGTQLLLIALQRGRIDLS
jgi:hypothetical protein